VLTPRVPSTLLLALALTATACTDPPPRGPNVLLISIDTLRPDHLSCYGYEHDTSPRIDRLAGEGVLFENHVSSSSWTLPSHTALFTSVPDFVHGVTDVRSTALAPGFTTLAERFRAAGWQTAGFFSGPYLHPSFGLAQGFQHYENCTSYAASFEHRDREDWIFDRDLMLDSHKDSTGERVLDAVTQWLSTREERPFFAFVHLWDPHFDFVPPAPWDEHFDPGYEGPIDGRDFYYDNDRYGPSIKPRDLQHLLALYDGEIRWTDSIVGKLLDHLDTLAASDDTIVALTSDHGTEFFEHSWKSHRSTLFDELVRIPLVIRAPGRLPAGTRVRAQTRMIDLGPTLLELAGLEAVHGVLGESLIPLTRAGHGDLGESRDALSELDGDWSHLRCLRTPRAKLIHDLERKQFELFDLEQDPHELRPIETLDSELGRDMAQRYRAAMEAVERARAERPGEPVAPAVSPALEDALRASGYAGDSRER
jgi:arylsulfatase A-like enzyme